MKVKLFVVIFVFGLHRAISNESGPLSTSRQNYHCPNRFAERTNISCGHYYILYPYRDKDTLDKQCQFSFTPNSIEYFTYNVNKFKYRFVNLRLRICKESETTQLHYTKCAIQPSEWVWTFGGMEGARQYLEWPAEYGTLSLGTLMRYTSLPLDVNVTIHGKCDVVVGEENTTERMALAFAGFINDLAMMDDKYNYSFWCFKERIFITNAFLYHLCKQTICPLETIGYKCCKQFFNVTSRKSTITCPGDWYHFGSVWWVCPFVIGVILYLYFGLILAWILANVFRHLDVHGLDNMFMDIHIDHVDSKHQRLVQNESTPLIQVPKNSEVAWINHNPVTVLSIISSPIRRCCMFHPITTTRIIRCFLAMSSLTLIAVKVFVHYQYHKEYIVDSVKRGAPKDFLSMIAGYKLSKSNFLVFLGGPFVAIGLYIVCLVLLICLPKDLADFIESGLPITNGNVSSPMWLDLRLRERFGSRRILCSHYQGYAKIQQIMLANILSLLNPGFWGYIVNLQLSRFRHFKSRIHLNVITFIPIVILGILYFVLCLLEVLLTITCFGLPTMFGITVVFKAYFKKLMNLTSDHAIGKCILFLILSFVTLMMFITFYMFSVIFVDSFIFIAKIAIFTYTGLFVDPSYTAGWAIFGVTIVMYIYGSIHAVNDTYEQLFVQIKKVCKRKGKRLKIVKYLYKKEIEGACIPQDLYKHIVHHYKPIRVQVFVSIIKICVIIGWLYISLGILTNFDGFQELNVVTQTATSIFVSLVPEFLKRMCSLNERRNVLRTRKKINAFVQTYIVYKGIDLS